MSLRRLKLAAFTSVCGFAVWGQPVQPAFEVTSVKPFAFTMPRPGEGPGPLFGPTCPSNGHFSARTMLQPVILWAYDVKHYQIAQIPEWAKSLDSVWSIEATSPQQVTSDQCRVMVQGLLSDRFKLAAHWERRDVPVQALTVAKGGSKMRAPNGEPGSGAKINGYLYKSGLDSGESTDGWTMRDLALDLDIGAGVRGEDPIVDRTGLEGKYQFDLEFRQFFNAPNRQNLPDLPIALQEQLGLKLEERKEPMDVLVIDHVEKPSPN